MAYPLAWPALLLPSSEQWDLNVGASLGGGRSIGGLEQTSRGPTGYVRAALTIPCHGRARTLAMRALILGLDGRAGTVLVPPTEASRAPWPLDPLTGEPVTPAVRAQAIARDPGYANSPDFAPPSFALAEPALAGATALRIARARGGILEPGQYLSLGDRLHGIVALAAGDTGGAGVVAVTVRPRLRYDYANGTPVEFGRPACLMRLANDDTGALALDQIGRGIVTLDLVEASPALA